MTTSELWTNLTQVDIKFKSVIGIPGDGDELLVGYNSEHKVRASRLYNTMFFSNWNMKRAQKKILKEIEILTGEKPVIVN